MDVICEGFNEQSRYLEYLYNEKKWDTAANMSSLTSLGSLISAKRNRSKSAIGYVIVSHTDSSGTDRLSNYGKYFFDIDASSNYDNISIDDSYTLSESKSLVPWTNDEIYTIPKGTRFISGSGIEFFSLETKKIRPLKEPYSIIKADDTKYSTFISAGGWDGIKYLRIPVIQGIQKEIELGKSTGEKFQAFSTSTINIENASNNISSNYFYITIKLKNGDTEQYEEIQKIRLAGPYEKVFESNILSDESGIKILFGDGVTGYVPPVDSIITLHYIETEGNSGNISDKYQLTTMIFPNNETLTDPRTGSTGTFLSCTNITSILGGEDIQTIADFKTYAPTSYIKSFTTATKAELKSEIMDNSPINLMKLKIYPDSSFTTSSIDTTETSYTETVENEISTIKNVLKICAIDYSGKAIEYPDENFIKPLQKILANKKGPNDNFEYVEPNFIKQCANLIIKSKSSEYTESDVQSYVKEGINEKYGLQNINFGDSIKTSNITSLAESFPFTDSVYLLQEAMANVSYDESSINLISDNETCTDGDLIKYIRIPFTFDQLYSSNSLYFGFKNYKVNSPYLLKIDIIFKNSTTKTVNNRTFFLYDNRSSAIDIETAKNTAIDSTEPLPGISTTLSVGEDKVILYDETSNYFSNRQSRIAQFTYISKVTSPDFMLNAKSFTSSPFELRPYIVDSDGKNKSFNTSDVVSTLQVANEGSLTCYKLNSQYFTGVDVQFTEAETTSDSASGSIILPYDYLDFGNTYQTYSSTSPAEIQSLLENYVDIKVKAIPYLEEFDPQNENDLLYIDSDDVIVEKDMIYDN